MSKIKLPVYRKRKSLDSNVEYQTRLSKNSTSLAKEYEKAMEDAANRKCERVGCECFPIVKLRSNFDPLTLKLASDTKVEFIEVEESIVDKFSEKFECFNSGIINDIKLEGYLNSPSDEVGVMSTMLSSVMLRYLLETRFKAEPSISMLELKKRGKFLEVGVIQLAVAYVYISQHSREIVDIVYQVLQVCINDGTYRWIVDANIGRDHIQEVEIIQTEATEDQEIETQEL